MSVERILSLLRILILLKVSRRTVGGRRGEQPKFGITLHLLKPWMNSSSTNYNRGVKRGPAETTARDLFDP